MRAGLAFALVIGMSGCSVPDDSASTTTSPAILVDVPSLIGADKADVDVILGTPECHEESGNLSCEYGGYNSAYFVDGKAANLTLPTVNDLQVYNLHLGDPDVAGTTFERWETEIAGTASEVSRFKDYIYVMTFEP